MWSNLWTPLASADVRILNYLINCLFISHFPQNKRRITRLYIHQLNIGHILVKKTDSAHTLQIDLTIETDVRVPGIVPGIFFNVYLL